MDTTENEVAVPFHEMGLDDRILEGIARLGWQTPTLIQEKAIPYFLEGKDVLARARTGSGKTGAFLIPLIHRILDDKASANEQVISSVVLCPSKELCKQTAEILKQLTLLCRSEVRFVDVSSQVPFEAQKPFLTDKPDVVIGTPLRILGHIKENNMSLQKTLQYLIVDEADLLFNMDFEKDIQAILKKLPKIFQAFVTSATVSDDVKRLKKLVLHNPVVLKLEEPPLPPTVQLTQYYIKLQELDKAVLLQVLFHLNMLLGKTVIFVNTVNKSYRLKMFLGQFGIKTCVLNSEMPVASRCHIVDEFNDGKYDIIVASDEISNQESSKNTRKRDKESGVSRGIDFQNISNIINFDFPTSVESYIHRAGRTARGVNKGTALSLVSAKEMAMFYTVEEALREVMDGDGEVFKHFKFNIDQLDGFRYRARDAWRRCTSIAIKETRKNELRSEILNSLKLGKFFKEHPKDLQVLRHDIVGKKMNTQPHLKHIPEYNIPQPLQKLKKTRGRKTVKNTALLKKAKARNKQKMSTDPLRTLKVGGFKNRKR